MTEPTPGNDSQRNAMERVLAVLAPHAANAEKRIAAGEADLRKYAEVELVAQMAAMIFEYPAIAALGYTAEPDQEDGPPEPPSELLGTVTMNPDAPAEESDSQEVDAEWELDNLLRDAGDTVAARVFEAKPGETATLTRARLVERANALRTEWLQTDRTS